MAQKGMRQFLLALQFLTILPIRIKGEVKENEISKSSSLFVLVGLIQGIFLLIVLNISERFFHPELSMLSVLFVMVLINGGFHLDGLADTFDALAVKSTGDPVKDKEKRLSVMKDSTIGAIGVTSLIFAIMLKFYSLKNISHLIPSIYYSSILLMPVVSKWTMTVAMFHGRAARENGLGRLFIEGITIKGFLLSTSLFFITFGLIYALFKNYLPEGWLLFYGAVILASYFLANLWLYLCNKIFSGSTGDTLGALSEIVEIIFLFMVIIWSRLFI